MSNPTIDFRFAPKHRWTCVSRPDDTYKTLVDEQGALLIDHDMHDGARRAFKQVLRFGIGGSQPVLNVHQTSESPQSAVTVTTLDYGFANLTLTAFGHEHGEAMRTDVVLWRIQANPDQAERLLVSLEVDAQDQYQHFRGNNHPWPSNTIHLVKNPDQRGRFDRSPIGMISVPDGLMVPRSHSIGSWAQGVLLSTQAIQGSRSPTLEGAILVPRNHQEVEAMDLDWARQALQETQSYWNNLSLQRINLSVPDHAIQDMITACARNILQAREVKNNVQEFQVGSTVYRDLWVVDGHFLLESALYLGYQEAADQGIRALIRRAKDDGSICILNQHTKETGIAIFTLLRQCELTGQWDRLRELLPMIRNAVEYIRGLRQQACALPKDDPCHGLMPPAFGDGGIGGLRGEYTTPLWTLIGLQAATRISELLGEHDDHKKFETEFNSFMKAFQQHAAKRMRKTDKGTIYLPTAYDNQSNHMHNPQEEPLDPHLKLTPGSGTWALCHAIYPGELFAPDDSIVQNLLALYDEIDDEEGVPINTGWLSWQSLWTYHTSFAAHAWLYAGRPDKAVDYLYAFANHASPTRVWREEQSLRSAPQEQQIGDMPHNWASAEFIRLVRHLLVLEKGATLELFPGLPTHWIVSGRPVVVENTPTRFGPISLRLEANSDNQVTVTFTRDPQWRIQPEAIILHLPKDVSELIVDGEKISSSNGTVTLPLQAQLKMTFQYNPYVEA